MRKRQRKEKPPKESFLEGLGNRLRETANLGHVLATEPRAFPGAAGRVLKRFVRTVWNARGGGLYACGFVVTLLWLETTTLIGEVASSTSLASFVTDQVLEFIFRFTVQSLLNTLFAFIWPVWLIGMSPLWGGLLLAALYFAFPRYINGPLTEWLFRDDEEPRPAEAEDASQP